MKRLIFILIGVILSLACFYIWDHWPVSYKIAFENKTIELLVPRFFKFIQNDGRTLSVAGDKVHIFIHPSTTAWPYQALALRDKKEVVMNPYISNGKEFFVLPDPYAHRHDHGSDYTTILDNDVAVTVAITPQDRSAYVDTLAILRQIQIKQ